MKHYSSLVNAIEDLKSRGYRHDFNLRENSVECSDLGLQLTPDQFTVKEFYRFEGMSSTDDNSIVFAIASADGVKGTMVDAYGVYAVGLDKAMTKRLGQAIREPSYLHVSQ